VTKHLGEPDPKVIVMMTKSSIVVRRDDATRITEAIERGDKTITVAVAVDMLGDNLSWRPTTVVLAHVQYLYDCASDDGEIPDQLFDGKVVSIRKRS
jgi:hypothetical protein